MKEISNLYARSADEVAEVYKCVCRAVQDFPKYYQGSGNGLFADVAAVYLEHLAKAEACMRKLSEYVSCTYESMRELDSATATQSLGGGSGGRC